MDSKYIEEINAWLITIDTDLDLYNIPDLRKIFKECIKSKKANFILDCTNMNFIDSTGLGELASTMKTVNEYGGTITIRGLRSHICRIFKLTGLTTILDIEGEYDE